LEKGFDASDIELLAKKLKKQEIREHVQAACGLTAIGIIEFCAQSRMGTGSIVLLFA